MSNSVDEELRIMEERASHNPHEHLEQPLDVLCRRSAVSVHKSASIAETVALMCANGFGAVLVTDADKLVGVFTERDVLKRVTGKVADLDQSPVSSVMTSNPETLRLGDKIIFVMNMMHVGGYRHVPIVDDAMRPLHVISIKDVMAYVLEPLHDTIVSIPPEPFRGERTQHSG